jgi:membrane protein YdbS with pleckstrin-like domain
MVIAVAGILRWALHIPASPVLSAIGIILALVIIVTLWTQSKYFRYDA